MNNCENHEASIVDELFSEHENKASNKKAAKHRLRIKRRLDLVLDKRRLATEIDTLYGDWD